MDLKTCFEKITYCFAMLFYSLDCSVIGQALRYSIAMPYTSLGAYYFQPNDPFGFTNNQAALVEVKSAL